MSEEEKDDDDIEILPEDQVSFVGPCTCDHSPEDHGWIGCNIENCDCSAAWEE